jgi:hypothetical protein
MARVRVAAVTTALASVLLGASSDVLPGEMFRARTLTFPYSTGAFFAMPHEKVLIAMTAASTRLFRAEAPQGALTAMGPNKWTWEAPGEKGWYPIGVKNPAGSKVEDFNAFVMVRSAEVHDGFLNGFEIGNYPAKPLNGNPVYLPPNGFIEVTKDNEDTRVSPHFRLKQFLTKQKSGYPKYLVLDERLIVLLEGIGKTLEPLGYNAGDIFIMSGYRTPFYNKAIGDTEFSMHQWGRAADIFLDKNHDGMMDDFNHDKVIDRQDAVALGNIVERMAADPEWSSFVGGIGVYAAGPGHGPFVHVDTRPWKARW